MQPNSAVTLQNNGVEIKRNAGQLLQGVVKSLNKARRVVHLSPDPDTVSKCVHVKTGDIYDSARVVRVDRGFGLLLEIPSTPVPTPAYGNFGIWRKSTRRGILCVLGFKASAFEGSVFTHSDAKYGMVVKGKVTSVGDFGADVQLSTSVKVLCHLTHMSELEVPKPGKKFKVGADLAFRVLGFKSWLISVTHKKLLFYVNFYNGVQGFARRG